MKTPTNFLELSESLRKGEITCVALVKNYLETIEKHKSLNAFLEVFDSYALKKAEEVDQKIQDGNEGKLAGMVVGIKDVLCFEDQVSTAGSKILEGFKSPYTGTAVSRLVKEDAIIIGRQNCDEFAMGSSNENSAYGPVKNGINQDLVPGGSSGGSAVAVQMDMCMVSLGTDTGGSVRQPAAFCGVYGLKPSYSRISRYGLIAYGSSFDCIGIFSKSIHDVALALEVMAGKDPNDSTSSSRPVETYSDFSDHSSKKRVGYLKETLEMGGLDPEIKQKTEAFLTWLKNQGHELVEVHSKYLEQSLPTYYILTTAEASTNLSRFDGVRYGRRTEDPKDLLELYEKSRSEGFGDEVKRRIMLGTFALSASYYDAYFTKAQKVRKLIREEIRENFKKVDFIVNPTTPTPPFKIGEKTEDILEMYLADIFTVQPSIGGFPAISVPYEKNKENLPLGIHIMSDAFKEKDLLDFAKSIENYPN